MHGDNNIACDMPYIGDVVEHRMNTNVMGIVIAVEGSLIHVRLSPSLSVAKFHEWELRVVGTDDDYPGEEIDPEADDGNVIDFTKARDLRTAKSRGAA